MNFDQLRYFVSIAETLNYSRSSQILSVTQPALSLSISRMEEEIGYPLFVKKGRNIELSPYGERFYGYANTMLNNMETALEDLQKMDTFSPHTISLALNICFNYDYINEILDAFREEYANCRTDIMIMDFSDIVPALQHGDLPFAITHLSPELTGCENFAFMHIADYPLFAFISERNPLSKEKLISIPMLNQSNLLVNTFKFKQTVMSANPKTYDPRIITVVADTATMEQMVADNEGVMTGNFALTPQMREKGIKRIPYANRVTKYALVWNKNRIMTNTDKQFKDFVANYVKQNPLDPKSV